MCYICLIFNFIPQSTYRSGWMDGWTDGRTFRAAERVEEKIGRNEMERKDVEMR
jgi:hypothetical protein